MPSPKILLRLAESSSTDKRLAFFTYEDTCKYLDSLSTKLQFECDSLPTDSIQEDIVVVDIETTGLEYPSSSIVLVGFWLPTLDRGYCFTNLDLVKEFLKLLTCNGWLGHNIKFDLKFLKYNGIELAGEYHDTMILHYLVDSNDRHGLKYLVNKLLGLHITTYEEATTGGSLATYCISDCYHTWLLYQHLSKLFTNWDLYRIEMRVMSALVSMESLGIKVDSELADSLNDETVAQARAIRVSLGWNPASAYDINYHLYQDLDVSFLSTTKLGLYCTDEGSLNQVKIAYPTVGETIDRILEYRKLKKVSSTYLLGIPTKAVEGILYTNFNQAVTKTGRLSSSNPNMQNIPGSCRGILVAREGYSLVSLDYSQCELRILAHLTQDPLLVDSYRDGLDVHTTVTAQLMGIDPSEVTKEQRRYGKTLNFGIVYGMGAHKLSNMLSIPLDKAEELLKSYWTKLPKVTSWIRSQYCKVLRLGYTETILGRRRYFSFEKLEIGQEIPVGHIDYFLNTKVKHPHDQGIFRECANHVIQGTNADITKIAMALVPSTPQCRLLLQIHDELVFEILDTELDYWIPVVSDAMTKAGSDLIKIPLVVDYSISKAWAK